MGDPKVVIVILRRPRTNNPKEMRSDPFWEFGSFGCTGCHQKNILNPQKAYSLNGVRLAFAQGGYKGFRLVYLTPPIEVVNHGSFSETRWPPISMPYRYDRVPVLVDNHGNSDFPLLKDFINHTARTTWEGKFSSRFRSRCKPVSVEIGREIVAFCEYSSSANDPQMLASTYDEALPYRPPKIDLNRRQSYEQLLLRKSPPI